MEALNKKYKTNLLFKKTRRTAISTITDTALKVFRNDKKFMSMDDIKEYFNKLKENDINNKYEILIRGRNEYKMTTIKGFGEDEIADDYDPDYWGNFEGADLDQKFYYLEITLREDYYTYNHHINIARQRNNK